MWGVYGEGSSLLESRLDWLSNALSRNKISKKTAVTKLKDWQSLKGLTAAEKESLKQKIYEYSRKDQGGKTKTYSYNMWGVYGEGSSLLESRLDWLSNALSRNKISKKTAVTKLKDWESLKGLTKKEKETIAQKIYAYEEAIKSEKDKSSSKASFKVDKMGVYAEGETQLSALLNWLDRGEALGLNGFDDESRLNMLNRWRSEMKLTKDEEYELDKRILELNKNITEEMEKQREQAEQQTEEQRRQGYELAQAAFEKEVNKKTEGYKKEAEAAKKAAEDEIAAIDAVMKKRQEDNADKKRQDEIDKIDAQLKYSHIDDLTRKSLLRKKQDILNEQAEADFEREQEKKKEDIQANYRTIEERTSAAIEGLQDALGSFTDRLAFILGNQTAAQQVAGNSTTQNIKIIQGNMSNDQLINQLISKLYSA